MQAAAHRGEAARLQAREAELSALVESQGEELRGTREKLQGSAQQIATKETERIEAVQEASAAREAAAIPLPREDTTPPVTNTYLVMDSTNAKAHPDVCLDASREPLSDGRLV